MRAMLENVAWGWYNFFRAMLDPPSRAWTAETTLRLQELLMGMPSITCREWHRPRPVRLPLMYTERWVAVRRALDRGKLRLRRRKKSAEPAPEVSINAVVELPRFQHYKFWRFPTRLILLLLVCYIPCLLILPFQPPASSHTHLHPETHVS